MTIRSTIEVNMLLLTFGRVQSGWRPEAPPLPLLLLRPKPLRRGHDEGLPPTTAAPLCQVQVEQQTGNRKLLVAGRSPDALMFEAAGVSHSWLLEAPPLPHDAGHVGVEPPHKHTATHGSRDEEES